MSSLPRFALSQKRSDQCNPVSLTVPLFKNCIMHRMDIERGVYSVDHGQGLILRETD